MLALLLMRLHAFRLYVLCKVSDIILNLVLYVVCAHACMPYVIRVAYLKSKCGVCVVRFKVGVMCLEW